MPSPRDYQSSEFIKLLLLGDPKSGKSGSLISLVKANYRLRIIDFDNLLDFFIARLMKECPDKVDNVDIVSVRDKIRTGSQGHVVDGVPSAWIQGSKLTDRWKYSDVDLGDPATWGSDTILVVDSLSRLCDAAYDFHETITPKGKSGDYDGRAVYGSAQDDVEKFLAKLTSKSYRCHVIVICHGIYMNLPDGTVRIFPQGVGQKLSPKIPQYFPNFVRYIHKGEQRQIQFTSNEMIHLAVANPDVLKGTMPIDEGLAKIFATLKPNRPQSLTLKRVS